MDSFNEVMNGVCCRTRDRNILTVAARCTHICLRNGKGAPDRVYVDGDALELQWGGHYEGKQLNVRLYPETFYNDVSIWVYHENPDIVEHDSEPYSGFAFLNFLRRYHAR